MTIENQINAIDIRIALLEARDATANANIVKKLKRKRKTLQSKL